MSWDVEAIAGLQDAVNMLATLFNAVADMGAELKARCIESGFSEEAAEQIAVEATSVGYAVMQHSMLKPPLVVPVDAS